MLFYYGLLLKFRDSLAFWGWDALPTSVGEAMLLWSFLSLTLSIVANERVNEVYSFLCGVLKLLKWELVLFSWSFPSFGYWELRKLGFSGDTKDLTTLFAFNFEAFAALLGFANYLEEAVTIDLDNADWIILMFLYSNWADTFLLLVFFTFPLLT